MSVDYEFKKYGRTFKLIRVFFNFTGKELYDMFVSEPYKIGVDINNTFVKFGTYTGIVQARKDAQFYFGRGSEERCNKIIVGERVKK